MIQYLILLFKFTTHKYILQAIIFMRIITENINKINIKCDKRSDIGSFRFSLKIFSPLFIARRVHQAQGFLKQKIITWLLSIL